MAGVSEAPALRRALGKWDLTAIGVNQVIGSAIFLLPRDVAGQIGPWGPLAFLAVGLAVAARSRCASRKSGSRFETPAARIFRRAPPSGASSASRPAG